MRELYLNRLIALAEWPVSGGVCQPVGECGQVFVNQPSHGSIVVGPPKKGSVIVEMGVGKKGIGIGNLVTANNATQE